jgi:16S rRNA (uracil1498-N3)-methyltransferase
MRHRPGDKITCTNGQGIVVHAEITQIGKDYVQCEQLDVKNVQRHWKQEVHLAVSLLQQPARFEWLLEKATEIGVNTIIPVITERTLVRKVNMSRFENLCISAMKQSAQCSLPTLQSPALLKDVLRNSFGNSKKCIAICEPLPELMLATTLREVSDTVILIGPEGDFTTGETDMALSLGWVPVQLGRVRLRAETAALCALHTFHCMQQASE